MTLDLLIFQKTQWRWQESISNVQIAGLYINHGSHYLKILTAIAVGKHDFPTIQITILEMKFISIHCLIPVELL